MLKTLVTMAVSSACALGLAYAIVAPLINKAVSAMPAIIGGL